MLRNLTVLTLAFWLAACAAKPVYKTECPTAPVTPTAVAQNEDVPSPEKTPQTDEISPATQETPAQNTALEEKEECAGETAAEAQTETANAPVQPETVSAAQTPDGYIARARQRQSLQTPEADTPSFQEEETIPLQDRLLSPFAYEPVSKETPNAPWKAEELKYGLYYSFIKAGTAYIKTRGTVRLNGREAWVLQTTAFSASVIDPFFKVRDVNYSWLDAENFYSLGYSQSVREGSYKRDEWLAFDYENNSYYGELQKKKQPRVISGPLNTPVLDMLTSLYFVRAQDLTPGKDVIFDIVNREKQYPLIVKVLKKETVKTAAGKFDCIVVEPQFRGEGIFVSKGKSLQVWLTDDEYKMPVKMKTEVFIGSVSAELLEYKRN